MDVTPIAMPEQVLVHLVLLRRIVASVQPLCWKSSIQSSIHFFSFVIIWGLGFVCVEFLSAAKDSQPSRFDTM